MNENKVKFGLKNVHAAKLTETIVGGQTVYTYGTPKKIPGAVNMSFDMQGGLSPFYADDIKYFVTYSHTGYEGDLEIAEVPEWFNEEIFGDVKDANGVLVESGKTQPASFALLFEFDGDVRATRHVLYKCTATRPALASATKEDTTEPQTSTMTISASPRDDDSIHAKVTKDTDSTTYNAWYSSVYETTPAVKITAITLSDSTLTVAEEATETITASTTPASPTNPTLAWSSSDTSVATVDADGKVTGVSAGDATILCAATDGSGVFATCAVTVTS